MSELVSEQVGAPPFVDGYLIALLERAAHALSAEFERTLSGLGAGPQVWRVLAAISREEGETVTKLAQLCLLRQPTMTKMLDRMARDGLVRRAADPLDRRVVRVRPTERGLELRSRIEALARRHEAEVLSRLPPGDGERLKALLRKVTVSAAPPARRPARRRALA